MIAWVNLRDLLEKLGADACKCLCFLTSLVVGIWFFMPTKSTCSKILSRFLICFITLFPLDIDDPLTEWESYFYSRSLCITFLKPEKIVHMVVGSFFLFPPPKILRTVFWDLYAYSLPINPTHNPGGFSGSSMECHDYYFCYCDLSFFLPFALYLVISSGRGLHHTYL